MSGTRQRAALTRVRTALSGPVAQRLVVGFAILAAVAALVAAGMWIVYGHPEPAQRATTTAPPAILQTAAAEPPIAVRPVVPTPVDPTDIPVVVVPGRPLCSTELSGAQPHVAQVGNFLRTVFGVLDIGGANGRAGGDHGAGLALDLMTTDVSLGDTLASYVLANRAAFGVTYVIWQQQYNDGNGWSMMEDRGSPTQNHLDHVHVSFAPSSDTSLTC